MSPDIPDPTSASSVDTNDTSSSHGALGRPLWIWPFLTGIAVAIAATFVVLGYADVSRVHTVSVQPDENTGAAPRTPCETDKITLETAVEVWYALYGMELNPTQPDLVGAGLLTEAIDTFEIRTAGAEVEVVPASAGECA